MASGKTDTYENNIIDHFIRGTDETTTSGYLALYSTAPGESSAGVELSGNGYARIAVALGAPSAGVAVNGGSISFEASGGAWSAIDGHSICNALTSGAILMYEDSVSGPTLGDGDKYIFDASDVTVTET